MIYGRVLQQNGSVFLGAVFYIVYYHNNDGRLVHVCGHGK